MTSFQSIVYTIPEDENLIKIVVYIDTRFLLIPKKLLFMENLLGILEEI